MINILLYIEIPDKPYIIYVDMPIKQPRKLLYSRSDSNWTKTIRVAIAPSYLDDCINLSSGPAEAVFKSYMKYVEEQRLPRGPKGSRSLQDVALEVLLRKLSDVDNLDNFPKHLAKRLWNGLNKRCVKLNELLKQHLLIFYY